MTEELDNVFHLKPFAYLLEPNPESVVFQTFEQAQQYVLESEFEPEDYRLFAVYPSIGGKSVYQEIIQDITIGEEDEDS